MATKTAAIRTRARKIAQKHTITMRTTDKIDIQRIPAPTKRALSTVAEPSKTDVNGSYTGKPKNPRELPVQDADDL